MRQIRDVLKSQRWATFPMVFKVGSTGGDPVSWFLKIEGGHSLALLLTSPALPLSQTNSREKELRFRVVCHVDVKEGRRWDWLARYRAEWREGRRGSPLSCSILVGKKLQSGSAAPEAAAMGLQAGLLLWDAFILCAKGATHHLDQKKSVDTGDYKTYESFRNRSQAWLPLRVWHDRYHETGVVLLQIKALQSSPHLISNSR